MLTDKGTTTVVHEVQNPYYDGEVETKESESSIAKKAERDSLRENSRKLIVQLTLPKVADHLKRSVSSRSLEKIKSI